MPSPYRAAFEWIKKHPHTDSGDALVKLTFAVWKPEMAFSMKEILTPLDSERKAIAMAVVRQCALGGAAEELQQIGEDLRETFPRLWALGCAANAAKNKQTDDWYMEDLTRG